MPVVRPVLDAGIIWALLGPIRSVDREQRDSSAITGGLCPYRKLVTMGGCWKTVSHSCGLFPGEYRPGM